MVFLLPYFFFGIRYFQSSKLIKIGFLGIGIFYGLATVVVAIFPCDSGCNRELINPSLSQIIHNFVGSLTYLLVPIFMILIGLGLKKISNSKFSLQSIIFGVISILLVYILVSNSNSKFIGLYQRLIESIFALWIIFCAFVIKNKENRL